MDRVLHVIFAAKLSLFQSDMVTWFLQEEFENGNPQEDGKKMFDPEDYSGTDSDEDEVQYGARRRKPDKAALRGNK